MTLLQRLHRLPLRRRLLIAPLLALLLLAGLIGAFVLESQRQNALMERVVRRDLESFDQQRATLHDELLLSVRANRRDMLNLGLTGLAAAVILFAGSLGLARLLARPLERQLAILAQLSREAGATRAAGTDNEADRIESAIDMFRSSLLRALHHQRDLAQLNDCLQRATDALRDARQELEARVAQRTAELSAANADLSREVAEHQEAQQALTRANLLYAALSATNQAIVHTRDRTQLFHAVCRIAVEHGGMSLAYVAVLDPATQELRPVASAGPGRSFVEDLTVSVKADAATAHSTIAVAAREARVVVVNDLLAQIDGSVSRKRFLRAGSRAAAVLPLFEGDRVLGVLSLHATEVDFFDAPLVALLTEMAGDVSFALDNFERERLRVAAEQELRLRERAIEASVNAIVIANATQPGFPLEYVNPAYERITGYSAAEVLGQASPLLKPEIWEQPGMHQLRNALREEREGRALLHNRRKDGRMCWNDLLVAPVRDEQGAVTHYVGILSDVTDAKVYEEQLEHQANHDALTGLPNRNLLRDRLAQAVADAQRNHTSVALAVLDLDRFKSINDNLGHRGGDEVLCIAAQRIQSCLRATDTVARTGGDEFVLVLRGFEGAPIALNGAAPDTADDAANGAAHSARHSAAYSAAHSAGHAAGPAAHAAGHLASAGALPEMLRRVQDALSAPLVLGGREMQLRCSIGLSMYPQDGRDIEQLLRNADDAMYEAKEQGRGSYHFYSADLNARIARRLALESGLRHALARGEFQVFYQPKVDLRTGQVSGAEALLRWTSPEHGTVSPAEFIPLAEENGLIEPIGAWVLATACEQLARWRAAGLPRITLSVNLSPRQLRSPTLVQDVSHLLRQCGVERGLLELEITETALMDDTEGTRTQIRDLRALDVRIAIDDFGTGYSALAYLQRFKADVLKIDRSFVQDVAHDEQAAAMVAAIIAMARSLGMSTLAEGVETEAQVTRLRALGCSEMQGWLFSPAIPADAMADLLATRRCLAVPGSIVT